MDAGIGGLLDKIDNMANENLQVIDVNLEELVDGIASSGCDKNIVYLQHILDRLSQRLRDKTSNNLIDELFGGIKWIGEMFLMEKSILIQEWEA